MVKDACLAEFKPELIDLKHELIMGAEVIVQF